MHEIPTGEGDGVGEESKTGCQTETSIADIFQCQILLFCSVVMTIIMLLKSQQHHHSDSSI